MRDLTPKKGLTNAKPVKSVVAHQEHCTDLEDPTQDRSLTNTSCFSTNPVILTQLTRIIPMITVSHHYQHPLCQNPSQKMPRFYPVGFARKSI